MTKNGELTVRIILKKDISGNFVFQITLGDKAYNITYLTGSEINITQLLIECCNAKGLIQINNVIAIKNLYFFSEVSNDDDLNIPVIYLSASRDNIYVIEQISIMVPKTERLVLGGYFGKAKITLTSDIDKLIFLNVQELILNGQGFNIQKLVISSNSNLNYKIGSSYIHGGSFNGKGNVSLIFDFLEIKNSTLKEVNFNNVIFPQNKENFHIIRTIFNKNIFVHVNWGKFFSEKTTSYEQLRDIYRMFKYEYDSIGNKTEANKFFAKEMEYYEKSLSWKTDWDKKIISMIQRLSNNYGNSWLQPLDWMIFIVLLASIYKYYYNIDLDSGVNKMILSNILPISEIGDFKSFLDLGYKLSWAFLVYQFIVALRRISQR